MSEATPSTPDFVAGSSASTQTLRDEPLNIVVDGVSFGPTLWTRLDIDIWHGALPRGECQRRPTRSEQYFIITRKRPRLRESTITKMITACAKAHDADSRLSHVKWVYAANSSSSVFASFRSRVSNPSVNHP